MVAPIGLYYPYTHFHDRGWLKVAALYWPRMARIAPLGYGDPENPDARALRDELDFVVDLDPGEAIRARVGLKIARALDEHDDLINERYQIPERIVHTVGGASSAGERRIEYRFPDLGGAVRIDNPMQRWPRPVPIPVPTSFRELVGLHRSKVHYHLRQNLKRSRLAAFDETGKYAAVHPNFAWAYMCMLADEIAEDSKLTPVADEPTAYANCGAWTSERFASSLLGDDFTASHGESDTVSRLGMLAMRIAVPTDPEAVPVERIIKIRKRYGAELDAFHDLITATGADLAAELEEVRDQAVLEAYLEQEVSRKIERPLEDLRHAMRGLGVDTALGAASIKFEFPAAAALAAGWAAGQPVVAGAGAAFGLGAWYRNWRSSRRDQVRASPVGYLWRVERNLKTADLLRRIPGGARRD